MKAIAYAVQPLNPLWPVRAAGPWGQWVVEKVRPDIMKKFSAVVKDENAIPQYIYQCNVQNPTGESAFHSMMNGFGWAKNPMIKRIHEVRDDVPITLLFGSRSWVDSAAGDFIQKVRPNSFVQSHIINQAGHHVYADRADEFNRLVRAACRDLNEQDTGEDDAASLEEWQIVKFLWYKCLMQSKRFSLWGWNKFPIEIVGIFLQHHDTYFMTQEGSQQLFHFQPSTHKNRILRTISVSRKIRYLMSLNDLKAFVWHLVELLANGEDEWLHVHDASKATRAWSHWQ